MTWVPSFYCQDNGHAGMGLFNRIKNEKEEDMNRIPS